MVRKGTVHPNSSVNGLAQVSSLLPYLLEFAPQNNPLKYGLTLELQLVNKFPLKKPQPKHVTVVI